MGPCHGPAASIGIPPDFDNIEGTAPIRFGDRQFGKRRLDRQWVAWEGESRIRLGGQAEKTEESCVELGHWLGYRRSSCFGRRSSRRQNRRRSPRWKRRPKTRRFLS